MKSLSLMILVWTLCISHSSLAKRVAYLPPMQVSAITGGFDTTIPTPEFCQNGFAFREMLVGASLVDNSRTGGNTLGIQFTFRNISSIPQTVKLVFEEFDLDACYTQSAGVIFPPCYKTFKSNGATGYPITFTLPALSSAVGRMQLGCQGVIGDNNCWLYHWDVVSGNTVLAAGNTLFGILALFNPASLGYVQHLCYSLRGVFTARVEITEDKGAITGMMSTLGSTGAFGGRDSKILGSSNVLINGGAPF